MNIKKYLSWLGGLILLLIFYFLFVTYSSFVRIIACDVGQGDSYLVIDGFTQILIDGGPYSGRSLECLERYMPYFDKHIDVLIATHADFDHIGGLLEVLEYYSTEYFILPRIETDSEHYVLLKELLRDKEISTVGMSQFDTIVLHDISLVFLWPGSELPPDAVDTNMYAYVIDMGYRGYRFLFTADAEHEVLDNIMSLGYLSPHYSVVTAPHHGSRGGLSSQILESLQIDAVYISVGAHNLYGLPAESTMSDLHKYAIPSRRTDVEGDLIWQD